MSLRTLKETSLAGYTLVPDGSHFLRMKKSEAETINLLNQFFFELDCLAGATSPV